MFNNCRLRLVVLVTSFIHRTPWRPGRLHCCHGCAIWRVPLGTEMLVTFVSPHSIFSSCLCGWFGWSEADSLTAGSLPMQKALCTRLHHFSFSFLMKMTFLRGGVFLFPAYCRVKLWAWHLERILHVTSLISYGKQRPVRSAPAPSPDKPGFLSPSHPSSPTGIPQLFWNPVGYWVMDISFSVSSSVSTDLYIFYLCHLKKEYLTALGSNLASKEYIFGN